MACTFMVRQPSGRFVTDLATETADERVDDWYEVPLPTPVERAHGLFGRLMDRIARGQPRDSG